MSNKLLTLVGYDGFTEGHTFSVNNLPYVHDELLKSVAYNPSLDATIKAYFERARADTLINFNQEVIAYLSTNGKYSDTLLRFPEAGLTKSSAPVSLVTGQNIEQTYDLANVLQYGMFNAEGFLMYMQGNYDIRVSGRFDYQSTFKGENIFTVRLTKDDADAEFNSIVQVDLSEIDPDIYLPLLAPYRINSKKQNQFVLEIQVYADCKIYPQSFIAIEPTISSMTKEFDVNGSFDQGFSDGFSTGKGADLGTINPLISLQNGTIDFDVDSFISKNSIGLAYCFANRVAVRLLADKLTGGNLNIHTNVDPESVEKQIEQLNGVIKQHLKSLCSKLLFNIQTTATPPIVLEGTTGTEIGGFISTTNARGGIDVAYDWNADAGPYPTWGLNI